MPALEHPSHSAFYCSHSLQATFPPNRARSAVSRKAHGLAKPGLAKGSAGVFIPEVRKPPNQTTFSRGKPPSLGHQDLSTLEISPLEVQWIQSIPPSSGLTTHHRTWCFYSGETRPPPGMAALPKETNQRHQGSSWPALPAHRLLCRAATVLLHPSSAVNPLRPSFPLPG